MIPKLQLTFLDRLYYSLNWILIFSMSCGMFYLANFSDKLTINPKPEYISPQTANILGIIFLAIGILIVYRDNNKFKLKKIESNLDINKKILIVELLANEMKYVLDKRIENMFKFYESGSFVKNANNVTIIVDDNAFWINVIDGNWSSITFGANRRNENRLKNKLMKYMNNY